MEKRNSYETKFESFASKFQYAIFKTYYQIISNQCKMKLFYILFLILDAAQTISLILFNITYSSYSQSNYSLIQNLINIIRQLVTLYGPNDFTTSTVCLYLIFFFLIVQVSTLFYFMKRDILYKSKKNFFEQIFFKFLLILNICYQTIFQIPIFVTLFSMFQCKTISDNFSKVLLNFPEVRCDTAIFYINIIISSLNIILFSLICLLNCFFFFDNRPTTNLPWSGAKNKIPLLNFTLKFILSFFYSFEIDNVQYYFKNIIVLCITIFIGVQKLLMPLYHTRIIYHFDLLIKGMFIFISIIAFINKLFGTNYTNDIAIIIIITSLFFGFLILCISFKIQDYFKYEKSLGSAKAKDALLKITLLIQDAKEFKINPFKRNLFIGELQKHRLKCIVEICPCKKYLKILNERNFKTIDTKMIDDKKINGKLIVDGEVSNNINDTNQTLETQELVNEESDVSVNECVFGTIKILLQELIDEFPKVIELNITFCYLMTYYLNNPFKSLYEIMKLSKKKLNLYNKFEIYYLHNEIEKKMYKKYEIHKDDDIDIESILQYNDLISKILDQMELTTEKTIEFWSDVKNEIKRSKIYNSANKISNCIKEMKKYYKELIDKLNFRNMNFLILYSNFLEKIIFNEQDGLELKEKILQIQNEIQNTIQNENHNDHNFFDMDELGTIVISGNLIDIGKILSVNLKMCSLFKYDKHQLVNNKINKIMPHYISIFHDSFLKRYLETAKAHIIDNDRIVFGLLSSGFIRPFHIHVKTIPNLMESIRFIGLMKKLKKTNHFFNTTDATRNLPASFILCSQDGNIFGITQKVKRY